VFFSALFIIFFSPVLFDNRFLASGDSILYYLPNFYASKFFWDPLTFSGFPLFADPQVFSFYPPAVLFSLLNSWNGFSLSAYVLASCFSYGYVYGLTKSRLAAAASGMIYGLSGYMLAHLGHLTIIHCTAWLPLIIWALETVRVKRRANHWIIVGSIGVACSFLASPQIFSYSLLVCAGFVIVHGWRAPVGRFRFCSSFLLILGLGIGLAAIQWLPTFELSAWSVREQMSFAEFISFSLTPGQIPAIFFPYLFGGATFNQTYFGWWNVAEMTFYVGLLPLMLATVAIFRWPARSSCLFWLGIALIAFLLMLGDYTPLAQMAFHVPVINKFRAPARHSLEVTFAVSVLSGLGIASILRRAVSTRLVIAICGTIGLIILGCLAFLKFFPDYILKRAAAQGIKNLSLLPWANPAVGIPLIVFLVGALILVYWMQRPDGKIRAVVLVLVLGLDMSSFAWFSYWRYTTPRKNALDAPSTAIQLRPVLVANNQRLLPVRGVLGSFSELIPNISRLWGVPSASGYDPLLLRRVGKVASMDAGGGVEFSALSVADQSLNLLAVRFITLPVPQSGVPSPSLDGTRWRHVEDTAGISVFENQSVMPRAWLVPEAISLSTDDALRTVKTSALPDGRPYNPNQVALVERKESSFKAENFDPKASASVIDLSNNMMKVKTNATSQAFLLTSDVYYPGWIAFVDGAPVKIAKADYALRGAIVPAGSHTVTFLYRPKSFYHGAAISILSLLMLPLIWLTPKLKSRVTHFLRVKS
jgi:hypothetical protein